MIRTVYSAAVATAAVAATLVGTAGTASAATPTATPTVTLAAATLVPSDHHGHHWHHWDLDFHPRHLRNANAQKILRHYFGDVAVDPDPSSGPTMLLCPNPPGPGQSSWRCIRRPVGSLG